MGGPAPVILDGGMSNALEELGQDLSDPMWTAGVLRNAPEAVAEVHRRYYRAGAQVATSASYQASVPGFVDQGMCPAKRRRCSFAVSRWPAK